MKNVVIGVAVLAIGAVAGWYALGSKTTAPATTAPVVPSTSTTETAATQKTAIVTYTRDGFLPKSITVKAGTTVTFNNDSSQDMWVASALHPTHQELPGFDELAGVGKGGSYQYTFVKVGTSKYHNHMNPSDFGSVTVTE